MQDAIKELRDKLSDAQQTLEERDLELEKLKQKQDEIAEDSPEQVWR